MRARYGSSPLHLLAHLAALALAAWGLLQALQLGGADPAAVEQAFVRSLQPVGVLSKASLSGDQVRHPDALLALKVAGADLSLDHGFPARIIVPALPGVHNTKWVGRIEFGTAA